MADPVDLAALRRLAQQATPGPWAMLGDLVGRYENGAWASIAEIRTFEGPQPDATFIAACDPGTVLALVEAVEAAQRYTDADGTGDEWLELRAALAPFTKEGR